MSLDINKQTQKFQKKKKKKKKDPNVQIFKQLIPENLRIFKYLTSQRFVFKKHTHLQHSLGSETKLWSIQHFHWKCMVIGLLSFPLRIKCYVEVYIYMLFDCSILKYLRHRTRSINCTMKIKILVNHALSNTLTRK